MCFELEESVTKVFKDHAQKGKKHNTMEQYFCLSQNKQTMRLCDCGNGAGGGNTHGDDDNDMYDYDYEDGD